MPRLYIHPLPVRIWHWINAFGFVLLILTGLHIRYADLISLVSFATAVRIHNWTGFVLIANVSGSAGMSGSVAARVRFAAVLNAVFTVCGLAVGVPLSQRTVRERLLSMTRDEARV